MRNCFFVLAAVYLTVGAQLLARADNPWPVWAYPVNPPGLKPAEDDGTLKHVPNSEAAYTVTQVRDLFSPPDWHPDNHPSMPDVVGRGNKPGQFACGRIGVVTSIAWFEALMVWVSAVSGGVSGG